MSKILLFMSSFLGMLSLKELDLSRCSRITDAGLAHIVSITHLEKLNISETKVTSKGINLLSCLVNLHSLDLGGLPCIDLAMDSLTVFPSFLPSQMKALNHMILQSEFPSKFLLFFVISIVPVPGAA